jgi:signal transduction histidine kinase
MVDNSRPNDLDVFAPQQHLYLFLLTYRWGSLLLAMWLFLATKDAIEPSVSLAFLLAVSLLSTLLITIFHAPLKMMVIETPLFLGLDVILVIFLLVFSGATRSPYILYALSPLLTGAFLFQMRGVWSTTIAFSLLYPLGLLLVELLGFSVSVDIGQLFTQLAGAWLVTILFGQLSNALERLQRAHSSLAAAHHDLTRQNQELVATHQQLEMIHELTLFVHAPDSQSVQQRLLRAVTRELDFSRAAVGLLNPSQERLEAWHVCRVGQDISLLGKPLSLAAKNGLISQVVFNQQVHWGQETEQELLSPDEEFNEQLGPGRWLILPLTWQKQTLGVLLLAVDTSGPADISDDRWAILTSLVSQAAVALGTVDRTRRLAMEEERNRIARDIHDTVAQSLFGIVFTLDACAKLLPKQAEMVKKELTELRDVADEVRHQVRQSILDIWPSDLTEDKFKADLSKYVTDCAPDHVFTVDFTISGNFDGLPARVRRSLYRVCQEALANAARHAGVDMARVYLYVEPEEVHLSIRDTGRGFDPKEALARERNRERFGLRSMQERVQTLGGTCDILSQGSQGTQILVRVPVG